VGGVYCYPPFNPSRNYTVLFNNDVTDLTLVALPTEEP
jgi:hypothetical protein